MKLYIYIYILCYLLFVYAVEQFPREALDVLLVLRCLRLVKIVGSVERFRAVVMTMANIAPSLLTYGGVLLVGIFQF